MKKLYLIRHAKAEGTSKKLDDFERNLSDKGKEEAKFMGKRLKKYGVYPDIVYTSSAKRAAKTTKIIAEILGYENKKIVEQDTLYMGSLEQYIKTIYQTPNQHNSLFIVAHNPTVTEVAEYLSGAILDDLPTSAIVCIGFEVEEFQLIKEGSGHILFYDYPNKHKDR